MARIDHSLLDLSSLDLLSFQDSPIHRLDPRAKLLTSLVFVVCVVSHDKYDVAPLLPYLVFPLSLIILADLPIGYLFKKLLLVAPFAVLVGLFNPLLDRQVVLQFEHLAITGGWLSFTSILLRFVLTVGIVLVLVASTSFHGICQALERLKTPRVFVLQLLFLYRYLFVLTDQAVRLVRARSLRTFRGRRPGIRQVGMLIGQLLVRTMERAERIHRAMLCRGFNGSVHLARPLRFALSDALFVAGWSGLFLTMRFGNLPRHLGDWIRNLLP